MVSYATRDDYGDVTFTIDQRGAIVRRILQMSGLPATVVLPANAFRGVAARALEDRKATSRSRSNSCTTIRMLSVPLLVADDLEDVAADWRAWADAYRLADAADRGRRRGPHARGIARRGHQGAAGAGPPQAPRRRGCAARVS